MVRERRRIVSNVGKEREVIKLKVRTRNRIVQEAIQNENPGFQLGDVLRWDEKVVPLLEQPRPIVGVVVELWHNGCALVNGTNSSPYEPAKFLTFEYLARVSVVDRA
jgi:hypothetical protein